MRIKIFSWPVLDPPTVEEIEVQKLRDTNPLTKKAENSESANEATLYKGLDVGIHGSPTHLILADLRGGRQSSMTSKTAVRSNKNSKMQFFIVVGDEKFARLLHL